MEAFQPEIKRGKVQIALRSRYIMDCHAAPG